MLVALKWKGIPSVRELIQAYVTERIRPAEVVGTAVVLVVIAAVVHCVITLTTSSR